MLSRRAPDVWNMRHRIAAGRLADRPQRRYLSGSTGRWSIPERRARRPAHQERDHTSGNEFAFRRAGGE
jgi:hypothetical protein